ncbi:magnesium/cobalt transporter CorA [Chloroflexota bacterium]
MSFAAYYLDQNDTLKQEFNEKDVKRYFESRQGLLWVDITEINQEDINLLEKTFKFHQFTIENCVDVQIHPPKIDDYGEYLFIVVHGINHAVQSDLVETAELAIFLGPNFVVSNHNYPLFSIEGIRQQAKDNSRYMNRGADFLTHALIDALIDNVIPTVDKMSDVAEDIENEVIHNPQQTILEHILRLKRSTLRIHRVMVPQRDVLNKLSRGEFTIIKEASQIFYRDVYDHIVRIEDMNQMIRDRADNALTTHLSSVANRQNETMKVLSIVAAIFLPLSLLAGIYGMNFEYMPELKWQWGYFTVLAVMGIAIATVIWRFWAHNWITLRRRKISKITSFTVEPEKLVGNIKRLSKRQRK